MGAVSQVANVTQFSKSVYGFRELPPHRFTQLSESEVNAVVEHFFSDPCQGCVRSFYRNMSA